MHDVELWMARQSDESRALRSVLRNHAEGYALLCFHYVSSSAVGHANRSSLYSMTSDSGIRFPPEVLHIAS